MPGPKVPGRDCPHFSWTVYFPDRSHPDDPYAVANIYREQIGKPIQLLKQIPFKPELIPTGNDLDLLCQVHIEKVAKEMCARLGALALEFDQEDSDKVQGRIKEIAETRGWPTESAPGHM